MVTHLLLPPHLPTVVQGLVDIADDILIVEPAPGPDESMGARICASIRLLDPPGPLVVVAFGSGALHLPAVALAQRSTHRRVVAYLLIEPELPKVGDVWPDAPVSVVSSDDWTSTQARLRGWELLHSLEGWQPPVA